MARTRALLTSKDREWLKNDSRENRRYQVISEVRNRLREELPEDVQLLKEHERGLFYDLYDALGRIYYCPQCGEGFPELHEAANHAVGTMDDEHKEIDTETLEELAPAWWNLWPDEYDESL